MAALDTTSAHDRGSAPFAAAYDPFHEPLLGDPYPFFALSRTEAPVFYVGELEPFVWGRPTAEEQARLVAAMVRFWHSLRGLIDERVGALEVEWET